MNTEDGQRMNRTSIAAITIVATVLLAFAAGCGNKEEEAAANPSTTTPAGASAAPAAAGGAGAPDQGKISTGADPNKAPSYPSMYGKPAGAN